MRFVFLALRSFALLVWAAVGVVVLHAVLVQRGLLAPPPPFVAAGIALPRLPQEQPAMAVLTTAADAAARQSARSAPESVAFLGFRLPDRGFCLERRQRFEVIPTLSRVGFDATTPIDTLSAISSSVRGFLEACPSDPAQWPSGRMVLDAASLSTGDPERDAVLRDSLEVAEHPEIVFTLQAFDARHTDLGALAASGTALCTMWVCGRERQLRVPVVVRLDDRCRLVLEGEVRVSLSEMGAEVGTVLGMPMLGDDLTLWFGIRARSVGEAARPEMEEVADVR